MDNIRYADLVRIGGAAGLVCAAILLVNAAKRGMLVPTSDPTQLLAPIAEVAAIVFVIGLFVWSNLRTRLAVIATVTNVVALALLVGVEFLINLVFGSVDPAVTRSLLDGPAGVAITGTSVLFLVATILLVIAFRRRAPLWALLVYGAGAIVVSLRVLVPELVLDVALAAMAIGIVGMSLGLLAGRLHAAAIVEGPQT